MTADETTGQRPGQAPGGGSGLRMPVRWLLGLATVALIATVTILWSTAGLMLGAGLLGMLIGRTLRRRTALPSATDIELNGLPALVTAIAHAPSATSAMGAACESLRRSLRADATALVEADAARGLVVWPLVEGAGRIAIGPRDPARAAFESARPVYDPEGTSAVSAVMTAVHGPCAMLHLPLQAAGELVGVLTIADGDPSSDLAHSALARVAAAHIAMLLRAARLERDLGEAFDDLRATQEQLVTAEQRRGSVVTDIPGRVVHDVNNLLTAIVNHAQLASRHADGHNVAVSLTAIEQAALDAGRLVRRVQSLSRPQHAMRRDSLELGSLVRQAMSMALAGHEPNVEVRLEPGPITPIVGAAEEIREALMNVLLNAVEAMPRGGLLHVRMSAEDGFAWVDVTDTGHGMTDEVRARALEPFFTTRNARGTGLGLSIVDSVMRRHEGALRIESAPGQGTRVALGFPIAVAVRAGDESWAAATA